MSNRTTEALIEQTCPSGRKVKSTLDADGNLAQVHSRKSSTDIWRPYASNFVYTAAGAVSSMKLGNGRFENTAFNSRLQPTQIGLGSSATNQGLLKLNYDYGTTANNGNVLSQTITVPTVGSNNGFVAVQTYSYDSLNRLKQATENITPNGGSQSLSWQQTFTFDRYGNRNFDEGNTTTLPKECTESGNPVVCEAIRPIVNPSANAANNRLSSTGWQYDAAGNTTVDAEGRQFTYDAENKQVKVKDAQNQTIGEYFYNGDGLRIKKVVPGTGETTIFAYDASNRLVAEYSTVVEPTATAKTSYLTTDHLGSPRITTDQFGQAASRRDFMPYGEEIARTAYGSDTVRRKFTTYERDGETDLDFANARFYSLRLGRFYSVDPENYGSHTEDAQSWNAYSYGRSNPIVFSDPDGLEYLICSVGEGNRECYRHNDDQVHKSMREGLLFYDGTKSQRTGLRSGTIRDENGNAIATYQQISHDNEIQALLWGAQPTLRIWETPIELMQPAPVPGGSVVAGNTSKAVKAGKGLYIASRAFKSSGPVGTALANLGIVANWSSKASRGVLEVVGNSDDALMLFNALRGSNKVRMVGPGKWVAESASGTGTITFRRGTKASKSGTNAVVDVNGVEPGVKKIHFVP